MAANFYMEAVLILIRVAARSGDYANSKFPVRTRLRRDNERGWVPLISWGRRRPLSLADALPITDVTKPLNTCQEEKYQYLTSTKLIDVHQTL